MKCFNFTKTEYEYICEEAMLNDEYKKLVQLITGTISECNKSHSTKKFKFNQEFVPRLCGHVKSLVIDSKLLCA